MTTETIYELTYYVAGDSSRPILRRGSLVELQAVISDALHYDLDSLSLVKQVSPVTTDQMVDELLELLEPVRLSGQFIEVKQTPINTANHKCRFCGKSIREIDEDQSGYWVHQGTNMATCTPDAETDNVNFAYPA